MENTKLLKDIFLFKDLSHLELIQVNKILRSRRVSAHEKVISDGTTGGDMFVVKDGKLSVVKERESGKRDVLAALTQGDHFGEISLIDRSPRSASVVADTDGELLILDQKSFRKLLDGDQRIKIKIYEAFLATLCARLRDANENLITAHKLGSG